ncbi:MAG: sulfate adenylyltransferase [Candidatus Methanofastidiosia archaeon]
MITPHGGKLVQRVFDAKEREKIIEQIEEFPKLEISEDTALDVENIAEGVFSPLKGFLCREDFLYVLDEMRLSSDLPWTIPITLDVEKGFDIDEGGDLILFHKKPLALMHIEEKFGFSKKELAQKVFKTKKSSHPAILKIGKMKEMLLGGKLTLIEKLENPFSSHTLKPLETRVLFKEKGWRDVAGFQTRNIPHMGHEYMQKTALNFVDGIFINPIIGGKKRGDFRDEVILEAYDALINHYYLKESAVLSVLRTEMRYAGPREAVFHSIIRKNFGCTHFMVGRDHAGVSNFYPSYASQEIFEEFPDLGIVPLFFKSFFYCSRCEGVTNEKICPHEKRYRTEFSGTKIREMLTNRKRPSRRFLRREVLKILERGNLFI